MRKSFPVPSFSKNSQTRKSRNQNKRSHLKCKHRNIYFESSDHFSHNKNRMEEQYRSNDSFNIAHAHPDIRYQNKSGNCKMVGHNNSYNCRPNPLASPFYPSKHPHNESHPGWLASSSSSESSNSYDDCTFNNCYCSGRCHQNSFNPSSFNTQVYNLHRPSQNNVYYPTQAVFSPKCSYNSLLNTLCLSPDEQQNFYTKNSTDLLQKYQPCCLQECSNRRHYGNDTSLSFYDPHCFPLSPLCEPNNKYAYDSDCPSTSLCSCACCEKSIDRKYPCNFNNFQPEDKTHVTYANSSNSSYGYGSECGGKIQYVNGIPKITSEILIQRKNKLKQLKSQCYDLKIYKELESIEELLSALIAQASPSLCSQPSMESKYIEKRINELKHSD